MNLTLMVPELAILACAVVIILLDLFIQRKGWLVVISLAGLAIAAGFTIASWGGNPQAIFNNMLAVDNFALFFKLLFLCVSALVVLASVDYVSRFAQFQGEYYALVLLSTLGMMLMSAATEFISIFIALELTSISLYALVGFMKDQKSTEASLKYLLLGAVASAVLLYGMAFVFGFTGKTQLGDIAQVIQTLSLHGSVASPGLMLGIVLLIAGFGFKIAAFPFQMWVPDVYEGAPTPITAYLSVASKAAGFAVILRVFFTAFNLHTWLSQDWGMIFAVLSAIGMTVGNVIAIPQTNIKRMLAYSSIAQASYIMLGIATMGFSPSTDVMGQSSLLFFLAGYAVTNMGAFIAVIAISNKVKSDHINDYAGMGKRAPLLSLALTLCLISLTGIPPTAGFMAKFFIFSAAVQQNLLWLVIIAVLNSVISAYYYLRVVKVMWFHEPKFEGKVPSSGALRVALLLCCLGVILLGIVPDYAMRLAEVAVKMFAYLPSIVTPVLTSLP
ncbi:MAG: NADH-quinone oxidoreductase subunit N [Dehalococcoidales bacterium]|nr:NADH-quinone oxidoreductase subunit N [Dehalococcoidales bacterium]